MSDIALSNFMKPLQPFFEMENVSDICINKPRQIWVEQNGVFKEHDAPHLSKEYLWQFARLVAEYNHREISRESPTLSSALKNGFRVQFVIEPACEKESFVVAIRKQSVAKVPLADYLRQGVSIKQTGISKPNPSVSSKDWRSQQEINLPEQKSELGNLSNSVASDQNIEAY